VTAPLLPSFLLSQSISRSFFSCLSKHDPLSFNHHPLSFNHHHTCCTTKQIHPHALLLMTKMPPSQHRLPSDIALLSSPQSPTSPHHRSSLRRLSSLANLHQLNPFNRRRSSHGAQPSDDDPYLINTYQQQSQHQQRRQSYMSLSEEPMPSLPKSRTFSNLPLTKNRRSSKTPAPMKPPSRIPTPSMGVNAKSRLASATKSILKVGSRRALVRSDTEPLLASRYSGETAASTRMLKENNPASKSERPPLPDEASDLLDTASHPPRSALKTYNQPQAFNCHQPVRTPRRASLVPPAPRTPVTAIKLDQPVSPPSKVTSRPRRRTMLDTVAVPLQSFHSEKPQRPSFGPGIQSRKLLTSRAAPTPPPRSCSRPSVTDPNSGDATSNINLASDYVTSTQSTAYWSGRLMAQFDRRRNDQLQACVARVESHPSYLDNDLNVCLKELQKKCITDAAKFGFAMFKAKVHVRSGTLVSNQDRLDSGSEESKHDSVEA
jgi:hypothetical protein